jgi:hypothetical protein
MALMQYCTGGAVRKLGYIYFIITFFIFFYIIKILFIYKILTQSSIKEQKIRNEKRKKNIYIKIIYREPLLIFYILKNYIRALAANSL